MKILNIFVGDDKWIFAALLTNTALMALFLEQTKWGGAWHVYDIPPEKYGPLLKVHTLTQLIEWQQLLTLISSANSKHSLFAYWLQ